MYVYPANNQTHYAISLTSTAVNYFSQDLPNGVECVWFINAPNEKLVQVSLKIFDTDISTFRRDCSLVIQDGVNKSDKVLFNDSNISPNKRWWTSSGSDMRMKFAFGADFVGKSFFYHRPLMAYDFSHLDTELKVRYISNIEGILFE